MVITAIVSIVGLVGVFILSLTLGPEIERIYASAKAKKLRKRGAYFEAAQLSRDVVGQYITSGIHLAFFGLHTQAIVKYRKAAQLAPQHSEVYDLWARSLSCLRRYEEAIEKYELGGVSSSLTDWACALYKVGRIVEAREKWRRAMERTGSTTWPDWLRETEPAAPVSSNARSSEMASRWCTAGTVLYLQDRYEESIPKYRRAVELKPDYAEAYFGWGVALFLLRRYEEAVGKLKSAILLKPDYFEAHLYYGNALHALSLFKEASSEFERASQLQPSFADAYFLWGITLFAQGDLPEARRKMRKAKELGAQPHVGWPEWYQDDD